MNLHLILHDIGYVIDVIISIYIIVLIFFKSRLVTAKIMLILTFVCVIIFSISHVLGVSVINSDLSTRILMFNMVDIFLPLFTAHCVIALFDKQKRLHIGLIFSYVLGLTVFVFFILDPSRFLLTSVPKMYFPNYYVPGSYYWVMLLYFFSVSLYFFIWLISIYKNVNDIEKNRIKYFSIALMFGYMIGSIDFLLIYNIPLDPLFGFLFVPLFAIPFTYAALQYDLLDISVIAKKAFIYAIVTAIIGIIFIALNYVSILITEYNSSFPIWGLSLLMAMLVSLAVIFIWNKTRESDVLKYEFINVVTHKFRTPLTSIKWIIENLKETAPQNLREDINNIGIANNRLVELTNLLVNLSGTDDKSYEYIFEKLNITSIIDDCIIEENKKLKIKDIQLLHVVQPELYINGDLQKIKFVVQTLLDNAVNYTPNKGKVMVELSKITSQFSKNKLVISISDTGIGIHKDDIRYIFTKFYRAENGRKVDTEGMGIGLYLSQKIIERHKGKISVQSAGENQGTTFSVVLPLLN